MAKKRVCIGKIVAAHGIRGEVKVQCFHTNPLKIDCYGLLENRDASRTFSIKVTGRSSANVRVKIKGVDTRNDAEALIGTELYADRESLPQLGDEEYYLSDIIGLDVRLQSSGEVIGVVSGFSNFGAGDIIEIRLSGRKDSEMLPFTKAYVPTIDIAKGYITVTSATMIFADEEV